MVAIRLRAHASAAHAPAESTNPSSSALYCRAVLNRFFNLARRQEPQAFSPRKHAMATTCFGQEHPQSTEPATFVPDEAPLLGAPAAPEQAAAHDESPEQAGAPTSPTPLAHEPRLALDQMVASVQDGLLMVFGPEGDPVPPQVFADAAASAPEAMVSLANGIAVPACRVATVLKAQTLGRLGAANDGGWIMTMLRAEGKPAMASEEQLAAEHEDEAPPHEPSAPGPEPVRLPPAPEPDRAASVAGSADPEDGLDPESILLVVIRGVPDDVRLSAGVRDDDGSWSLSPLDLPDLTITPASGEGPGEIGDREITITGIALRDGGALAAVTETVPLADYLTAARDTSEGSVEASPTPDSRQLSSEGATIALDLDPALWQGLAFDALVIRNLPAGARLSAGAHDPAIDGWVLRPQDLAALAIIPPAGQRTDCTLTLLGVTLRPGGGDAARVLARLPVTLA
jgi:hypothetical protein